MSLGEGRWNEEILNHLFPSEVAQEITLPHQDIYDSLIWHDTNDGVFTVKSAYHLEVLIDHGQSAQMVSECQLDGLIKLYSDMGAPYPL